MLAEPLPDEPVLEDPVVPGVAEPVVELDPMLLLDPPVPVLDAVFVDPPVFDRTWFVLTSQHWPLFAAAPLEVPDEPLDCAAARPVVTSSMAVATTNDFMCFLLGAGCPRSET
jgi:hypothetical protein